MAEEKTSLSPRDTVVRMLLHAEDDISYEEIIRQLRILQQIERTFGDQHGISWLEEVTPDSTPEPFTYGSPGAPSPKREDIDSAASSNYLGEDPFGIGAGAAIDSKSSGMESADYASFASGLPSFVLRSQPLYSWRTLAERFDDRTDSFFNGATWIY